MCSMGWVGLGLKYWWIRGEKVVINTQVELLFEQRGRKMRTKGI